MFYLILFFHKYSCNVKTLSQIKRTDFLIIKMTPFKLNQKIKHSLFEYYFLWKEEEAEQFDIFHSAFFMHQNLERQQQFCLCMVKKHKIEWQLKIVGGGKMQNELKQTIDELNLNDSVTLIFGADNIQQYYRKSSFLVCHLILKD